MDTAPCDIHYALSEHLDINELRTMSIVFRDEIIYKFKLLRMKNAIRTIEKIYDKNNAFKIWDQINCADTYNPSITTRITKNIDIRVRSVRYHDVYYQKFPEYLVNNCRHMFSQHQKDLLTNYIQNNLDNDKTKRKRSSITKFLRLPQIKIEHLNHAGW